MHAADAATLGLLHFVSRGLQGASVLVIATARDVQFATAAETPGLLARIAREARHLPLDRLDRDEIEAWVHSADSELPAARVWEVSEGNPLFVSELLAAARGSSGGRGPLPLGIREAVHAAGSVEFARRRAEEYVASASRHLDRLPPSAPRETLRRIADYVLARRR